MIDFSFGPACAFTLWTDLFAALTHIAVVLA